LVVSVGGVGTGSVVSPTGSVDPIGGSAGMSTMPDMVLVEAAGCAKALGPEAAPRAPTRARTVASQAILERWPGE
jgi:hypothetical protein